MPEPFEVVLEAPTVGEAAERLSGMGLSVVVLEPAAGPFDSANVETICQILRSIRKEIHGVVMAIGCVGAVLAVVWLMGVMG